MKSALVFTLVMGSSIVFAQAKVLVPSDASNVRLEGLRVEKAKLPGSEHLQNPNCSGPDFNGESDCQWIATWVDVLAIDLSYRSRSYSSQYPEESDVINAKIEVPIDSLPASVVASLKKNSANLAEARKHIALSTSPVLEVEQVGNSSSQELCDPNLNSDDAFACNSFSTPVAGTHPVSRYYLYATIK